MSAEAPIVAAIRLHLGRRKDIRLFRNNVGFTKTARGQGIHYGLFPGSADLIGWITRHGVAVFLSIEIKSATGRVSPTQANWQRVVHEAGGVALIVSSVAEVDFFLIKP